MTNGTQSAIESGFESIGHYEESMRDFDRVLDYLDRNENISEEGKEKFHHYLDEIGMDGVFELARNTNKLFKELGINSYRLQQVEHGRIAYANSLANLTPEERSEHGRNGGRKGNEAQGNHMWSLEEIVDIANFREESIGKGYRKNQPIWNDTTSKMNEKYDKDWTTNQVRLAYHNNKDLPSDEEE
jgi:hypothetical protein